MPDPWAVVSTKPAQDEWQVVSTRPAPKEENKPLGWRDEILHFWRPLSPEEQKGITQRLGNIAGPAAIGFSNTAMGTAEGATNLLVHPLGSIWGTAQTAADALNQLFPDSILNPKQKAAKQASLNRLKDQWEQIKTNPDYAMGNLAGAILGADVASEAVGSVTRGLKETVGRAREGGESAARSAAGTNSEVTRELVKKTQARNEAEAAKTAGKNAAEVEKAQEANAKQESKRKAQVEQYGRQLSKAEQERIEKQNAIDRKAALNRGVETLDTSLRSDLEKVEEQVNTEANRRYNELAGKLNHVQANPDFLPDAVTDSAEKIKGSDTEPAILRDMEKKIQRGDIVTYEDLQGYRSELGRELRKGSLPGDVFHAYKTLQSAVTDEMERIADNNDVGDQFRSARDYYRKYAETFLDRDAVARKALDSKERGGITKAYQGKDQSGIEQISQFDPELAKRINTVRNYAAEAKSIHPPRTATKEPSLLPSKPVPVEPRITQPDIQKIGDDAIRNAKREALEKRANWIRHRGVWIATWPIFEAMRAVWSGHLPDVPGMAAETIGTMVTVNAVANLMERPAVVNFLTKATAKDIAEVPEDLRGDLPRIVKTAQGQGIKVSPALAALVGSGAAIGPKTQSLQKTANDYRTASQ